MLAQPFAWPDLVLRASGVVFGEAGEPMLMVGNDLSQTDIIVSARPEPRAVTPLPHFRRHLEHP